MRRQKRLGFLGGAFGALLIFLVALAATTALLAVRLVEYSRIDKREILLETNLETEIDLFAVEYENLTGEITVAGAGDTKVIAPGTSHELIIRLRNRDKIALDYQLVPSLSFTTEWDLPIVVRMRDQDGNYLIGDRDRWVTLEEMQDFFEEGTVYKNQTVEYIFEWQWPFESGSDAYDTFLGTQVDVEGFGLSASFHLTSEANTNVEAYGGRLSSPVGGLLMAFMACVALLVTCIMLIIFYRRGKGPKDDGTDGSDSGPSWTNGSYLYS